MSYRSLATAFHTPPSPTDAAVSSASDNNLPSRKASMARHVLFGSPTSTPGMDTPTSSTSSGDEESLPDSAAMIFGHATPAQKQLTPISSPIEELLQEVAAGDKEDLEMKGVEALKEMLPNVPISELRDKLASHKGNVADAADAFFEEDDRTKQPPCTPPNGPFFFEKSSKSFIKKKEKIDDTIVLEDSDDDFAVNSKFDGFVAKSCKASLVKDDNDNFRFKLNLPKDDPFVVGNEFDINSIKDDKLREKVEFLCGVYPQAGREWTLDMLNLNHQDLITTIQAMRKNADPMTMNQHQKQVNNRQRYNSTIGGSPARRQHKRDASVLPKYHLLQAKKKKEDEKAAAKLKPADAWVEDFLKSEQERVNIFLGPTKEHRHVPKKLIVEISSVIRDQLAALPVKNYEEQKLEFTDITPRSFDLLLQWIVCKDATLLPLYSVVDSNAITSYLDFVLLAHRFNIKGPGILAEQKLKAILIRSTEGLKGEHIKKVFELPKDDRLRSLFARAVVKPWIIAQEVPKFDEDDVMGSSEDMSDNEVAMRKIAFGAQSFPFKNEYDSIPDFKMELLELANATITKGEIFTTGKGNRRRSVTNFIDPLTGWVFSVKRV